MKIIVLFVLVFLTACMRFNADTEDISLLNFSVVKKYKNEKDETVVDISKIKKFGAGAGDDGLWGTSDDDVEVGLHIISTSEKYDRYSTLDTLEYAPFGPYTYSNGNSIESPYYLDSIINVDPLFSIADLIGYWGLGTKVIEQSGDGQRLLSYGDSLELMSNYAVQLGGVFGRLNYYIDITKTQVGKTYIAKNLGEDLVAFTSDDEIFKIAVEDYDNKTLTIFDSSGQDAVWQTADDNIFSTFIGFENISQIIAMGRNYFNTNLGITGPGIIDRYSEITYKKYQVKIMNSYRLNDNYKSPLLIQQLIMLYDNDIKFQDWNIPVKIIVATRYSDQSEMYYSVAQNIDIRDNSDDAFTAIDKSNSYVACPFKENEPDLECLINDLDSYGASQGVLYQLKRLEPNSIEFRITSYQGIFGGFVPSFYSDNWSGNFYYDGHDQTKTWLIIDETK